MYATLRLYRLNPIFEKDFIQFWGQLIEELKSDGYSINAVLHKESKISYISYMQWPSKEDFDALQLRKLPKYNTLLAKIDECCNSNQVIHRMHVLAGELH